jgi:Fe(3+) dicitrate transport protein
MMFRILRTVPGLTIQEEDGFGLHQTLECGTKQTEARKITLMEDGLFGTILLLQRIISHGEQNAIFRNIKRWKPDSIRSLHHRRCYQHGFYSNSRRFSGRVTASIGSFNTKKTYVST